MLVYSRSNSLQMLGFCKPLYTVPKCHPLQSNLSRILGIPWLCAFAFCPLCSEILSIKNFPALCAATSVGSKPDVESCLNSQRLETCVSVILWVSRSCMEYLSLLIPTTMLWGPAFGIRSFSREPSGGFNNAYEFTGNISLRGDAGNVIVRWISCADGYRKLYFADTTRIEEN